MFSYCEDQAAVRPAASHVVELDPFCTSRDLSSRTFAAVMCRTEAKKLWALRSFFEENGIRPVCIVHEWILPEVAAFSPSFWGGEVLLDRNKAFYRALGGGVVSSSCLPFPG